MQPSSAHAHAQLIRAFANRVGHDAIWLIIAALFCVVEGAVKVTELRPSALRRRRPQLAMPVGRPTLKHS